MLVMCYLIFGRHTNWPALDTLCLKGLHLGVYNMAGRFKKSSLFSSLSCWYLAET